MEISKKLNNYLQKHEAIIFTASADVLFLTKFVSSNMKVIYIKGKWFAITDERYLEAAHKQIKHMEILNANTQPYKKIIDTMVKSGVKKICIDYTKTSLWQFENMKKLFGKEFEFVFENFHDIRQIKTKEEIKATTKACLITDKIFAKLKKEIKVGKTEKQVKKALLKLIYDSEATGPSFDPIVAAGPNGSKPHWRGSEYKIKSGDMITIDFGVMFDNMCSDMTRTLFVGKIGFPKQKELYELVLKAQMEAIKAIKPGVKANFVDGVARKIIEEAEGGYGKYFTHGLGHSMGYEIHENPRLNQKDETILEPGMIVTVEPGLYIAGQYGLRIEDDILVTKKGAEILNKTAKKLEVVK